MRMLAALSFVIVVCLCSSGHTDIPRTLDYQGVLTDAGGTAVPDGSYSLVFRIYSVPTGGSSLWGETQSVNVSKGIFNVTLGSVTPLALPFDAPYYIGIAVEGEAELSPRIALASAGYSYYAGNADKVDGIDAAAFAAVGHHHDTRYYTETELSGAGTINNTGNPVDWTKLKNVPGGFSDGIDDTGGAGIGGSGTANRVPLFTAPTTLGNSVIRQVSNNIGIGWDNPVSKLEVNGMCRVVGLAWPPSGRGLELGYNGAIHRGYIQVFDRDTEGWGELCLGLGRVGIGDCYPDALLDVQNNTEHLSVQMAENDMALRAENEPDTSKVYLCYSKYGVWSESNLMAVYADNPTHGYTAFLATDDYAVRGYNDDGPVSAYLANGDKGVDAINFGSGHSAELATDYHAGYFDGPVDIQGTLSKTAGTFKIDHPLDPENKFLYHSFVEYPDMMNVYNRNVVLDAAGGAWVELPAWFEALNGDFRYQLTCIGAYAPVYVAEEIAGNRFKIAGGSVGLKVSWMVTGVRRDPYAERYRTPVEEDKPPEAQGRYIHPEVYGLPESRAIHLKGDERFDK